MIVNLMSFASKTHPFIFLQQRAERTQPPAEDPLAGTETQGEGQNAQGGQQQGLGQSGQDNGGTASPREGDSGNGQQQNSPGDGGDTEDGGDGTDPPVGEDDAETGEGAEGEEAAEATPRLILFLKELLRKILLSAIAEALLKMCYGLY